MKICFSDDLDDFDEQSINEAIDLKITVQMITHSLPKKTEEYMGTLLQKYLTECGMDTYFNKLNYCLYEILNNAIKANIKRIYFDDHEMNINNPEEYEKGMENFRTEMLEKKEYFLERLRYSEFYVTYSLTIEDGKLIIEVRNNSLMTEGELKRVQEKIKSAGEFDDDVTLDESIDETEGAGIGIRSIILTLRSFGLPGDHYLLYTEGSETVSKLIVEQPLIEL